MNQFGVLDKLKLAGFLTLGVIIATPVILFLLVAFLVISAYEKIKFYGAPPGCCQGSCSNCPWGDLSCIWHRSHFKGTKIRPRVNK